MSLQKTEFQQTEEADEVQIIAEIKDLNDREKDALAYQDKKGKFHLSYSGVKHLALLMSQQGHPLKVEMPVVELLRHDLTDQTTWHWYSTIKLTNATTHYEVIGASEQPYLITVWRDEVKYEVYDNFGRVKALSKAERNAIRKHIPEAMLTDALNTAIKSERTQNLQPAQSAPKPIPASQIPRQSSKPVPQNGSGPTEKQISYLKYLKHTGPIPASSGEASTLIDRILKEQGKK